LTKPIPSAVHDVWIGLVSSLVVTRYRPRSGHRGLYWPGLSGGCRSWWRDLRSSGDRPQDPKHTDKGEHLMMTDHARNRDPRALDMEW